MNEKYTVLVTGGAGNVGSAFAEFLKEKGHTAIVADNFSTGKKENISRLDTRLVFNVNVNHLAEIEHVFKNNKIDFVFHYAAVVGVKRTLNNPLLVFDDIKGIENILNLSVKFGVKRVFYASSSEVYGEPFEIPQNEDTTPLNSRLPYAIVKNLGEAYFRTFKREYNLDYTIFRFFNTYGEHQSTDFVIPLFLEKALQQMPIEIYGDGSQTRTFCYIKDNVEAAYNAMVNDAFVNDVINIGNDTELSVRDLAETIIKITGSKSPIVHVPALDEGDMTRRKPDISKMKTLLKRELTTLEDGLQILIKNYSK